MANKQTNTNLNQISLNKSDPKNYWNNYFKPDITISSNVDAAILSYFERVAENRTAAKALASAVIYTAKAQNVDPMVALDEFTKVPRGELNAYLTMFLNMQRVGTSYLGITNEPTLTKYVQRAILP